MKIVMYTTREKWIPAGQQVNRDLGTIYPEGIVFC